MVVKMVETVTATEDSFLMVLEFDSIEDEYTLQARLLVSTWKSFYNY